MIATGRGRIAAVATTLITLAGASGCASAQPWRAVPLSQSVSSLSVHGTIDLVNGVQTDGTTCAGADEWSYLHTGADATAFDGAGAAVGTAPLGTGVPLDAFDCQWTVRIVVPRAGTYDLVVDSIDIGVVNTAEPFALTVDSQPHQGNQS